jgi:glycosyltransferase involved in cell wall biosynthesis
LIHWKLRCSGRKILKVNEAQPIRVMRIIARLNIGGPAIHVALLSEKFSAPAYETMLVAGQIDPTEGDMSYFAANRGVTPRILPELGREISLLADLKTIWALWKLMRQYQPDVVHTHTAKAGFAGRIAAWLAGVPVIVHTFHGHVFRGYFSPLKTRAFILIEQIAARMSGAIITLTEGLRRELADEFHIARRSRITVLPLGFDLRPFLSMTRHHNQFRDAWGIPPKISLVGIIGRMVPVKNHALFLQAAARLRQTRPDVRFVLVGDGELRAEIEAQIDTLGLRDAVTVTGWQQDMAPIYGDLDLLVISSLNEGTPVTIIEALSSGCPVVATSVGGLPDLLEGGKLGRLVPSGDAVALAEAMGAVLAAPPDPAIASQLMQDRYSIDRLAQDLDHLYRALLMKKGLFVKSQ